MGIRNLQRIAGNSAFIFGLAVMTVSSAYAQNSNTGGMSNRTSNSTTVTTSNTGANTGRAESANTGGNTTRVESANTPTRTETATTPRTEASTTPRTQVQTVVEKESSFPWGLLGLLGLAGLIPKKRSVEVTGVRETERETRTTTDTRNNKPNN